MCLDTHVPPGSVRAGRGRLRLEPRLVRAAGNPDHRRVLLARSSSPGRPHLTGLRLVLPHAPRRVAAVGRARARRRRHHLLCRASRFHSSFMGFGVRGSARGDAGAKRPGPVHLAQARVPHPQGLDRRRMSWHRHAHRSVPGSRPIPGTRHRRVKVAQRAAPVSSRCGV